MSNRVYDYAKKFAQDTTTFIKNLTNIGIKNKTALNKLDEKEIKLIVTAGGTGCAIRDNTPEATLNVCERIVPGLSEEMRRCSALKVRNAILSRGVCGIRHGTLIINLPGDPDAAEENLEFIIDLLPYALEIMSEEKIDCSKTGTQRHRR